MKNKLTYLILILALCLGFFLSPKEGSMDKSTTDGLQLSFVDVGQGDCTFIKTPNGETWLVDGGDDGEAKAKLLPFLADQGIDAIDYAVVSHYHNDHTGGIFQLLKSGRIKNLILPNYVPDNKAKSGLMKNAEVHHTAVLDVSAGDALPSEDKNLKISVLHPEKGGFSTENENSNSMVLKIDYFDTSVLLTGDLESDAENVLLPKYDLEVDILKLGHHGSSTSTDKKFLTEVNPTYGIISAGADNSYGHPHYEVLDLLKDDDVMVYRTDQDGDITFVLGENGIKSISTSNR